MKKINARLKIDQSLPLIWYFCYFVRFPDLYGILASPCDFLVPRKVAQLLEFSSWNGEGRGFPLKNFDDSSTHFSQFWHENSFGRHSNTEKKVERRIGLEFP